MRGSVLYSPLPVGSAGLSIAQYPGPGLPFRARSAAKDQRRVSFSIILLIRPFRWVGTLLRRCPDVPARCVEDHHRRIEV